ncbi:MAG: sigma-70 family RNA polymerase sigma factor [Paludisphaera borealis]|uniref:RNA polymerase sigma factor n=1 Tax=Paludisphaera borealis TaxID=1387353 RepID=UPI00283B7B04|nr:sigma-70 family RNA polymerase sigma factor [Paludisphaera borealis]MDR3618898.1 sigma-70 family RNA polymerase sigma factor [Paludisphaera borealis]
MIDHASDATLLKRFAERREETAFAELVERHGPVVQRVCRRFLRSEHDVEEVFQATFLILALRASEVSWKASVGGWVQDVARRLALHARGEIARRGRREVQASSLYGGMHAPECPVSAFGDEVERQDVRRMIDTAVEGLPEKYRAPLVLCYLEGLTNHEAAQQLGYPVGSISRRLERARGLLKKQLIGYGVTLSLLVGLVALGSLAANRNARRLEPIRGAMALVGSETAHQSDLRELIQPLERSDSGSLSFPDRERLGRLAEQSARAADAVSPFNPGVRRDVWRAYAGEMKLAALELSRVYEDGREPELLASVRRLNATCVQCHTTFH